MKFQAAQTQILTPGHFFNCQTDIRHALHHRFKGRLPLDPGQRRSKTEVGAPGEGHVPVILARDIKAIRLREALGVAIGCPHHRDGRLSLTDEFAS